MPFLHSKNQQGTMKCFYFASAISVLLHASHVYTLSNLANALHMIHNPELYSDRSLGTISPATPITVSFPAKCLDGSSYKYYYCEAANTAHSTEWAIMLPGGGWCFTNEECYKRSQSSLGNSQRTNHYCLDNLNTHIVYLPYCDGASFGGERGTVSLKGHTLHYSGKANFDTTITHLLDNKGLRNAETVVLTGSSAGGIGVFFHLHRLINDNRFKDNAKIVGVPNAGFFIKYKPFPTATWVVQDFSENMKKGVSTHGIRSVIPESCTVGTKGVTSADDCLSVKNIGKFSDANFFIMNSKFDTFQLEHIAQIPCVQDTRTLYYSGHSQVESSCSSTEDAAIRDFSEQFMTELNDFFIDTTNNAAFVLSCLTHGNLPSTKIDFQDSFETFDAWMSGSSLQTFEECPNSAPCNENCRCMPSPGGVSKTYNCTEDDSVALGENISENTPEATSPHKLQLQWWAFVIIASLVITLIATVFMVTKGNSNAKTKNKMQQKTNPVSNTYSNIYAYVS